MNEITEYKVLIAKNLTAIAKEVQKAIAEGWQPYGEMQRPTFFQFYATQVVVRYKEPKVPAAA